jgi:hypothetical protein
MLPTTRPLLLPQLQPEVVVKPDTPTPGTSGPAPIYLCCGDHGEGGQQQHAPTATREAIATAHKSRRPPRARGHPLAHTITHRNASVSVLQDLIYQFIAAWEELDPYGTCFISVSDMTSLLLSVPAPLGVKGLERPHVCVQEAIMSVDIPCRWAPRRSLADSRTPPAAVAAHAPSTLARCLPLSLPSRASQAPRHALSGGAARASQSNRRR